MNQENVWRKRLTTQIECPSGNVVTVRRPGPDLALKAGKITRIFQKQKTDEAGDINKQLEFIENLPDDELQKLMDFARVLIVDVVLQPVLKLHPQESQLGPDDVPPVDFWFIFAWATNGGPSMPVKMAEGETTVEAVSNFPSGQVASDDLGSDSEQVQ